LAHGLALGRQVSPPMKTIITVGTIVTWRGLLLSSQIVEFKCPYCDRRSASPGGVRFHVKLTHPEKVDEFNKKHYSEMEAEFKAKFKE